MTPLLALARLTRPPLGRLLLAALAGSATVACSIGLMATSGWLLARAAQQPHLAELAVAIVAVRAFGTARGFLRYGERLVAHDTALRMSARLRVAVYERLAVLAPGGLDDDPSGDVLHRLVDDVESLEELYLRGLNPMYIAAVTSLGSVIVAAVILPAAGVALAVTLAIGGVVTPALSAAAGRRAGAPLAAARGRLSAAVVDTITGAPELVAYGAASRQLASVRELEGTVARLERREARATALGAGLGFLVSGLAVVAVLSVAVPAAHDGRIDLVAVAALAFLALAAFEAVVPLPAAWSKLAALDAAAARITEVLDRPVPVVEPLQPRPLHDGRHRIELRDAQLSYDGGRSFALDRVDLVLAPGKTVALVGPSGAGKTSLAQALVRFHDLSGGVLLLDGVNVQEYAGDDVRRVVGLVEQRPHLFHASLRDNLRLAKPEADDEELTQILERCALGEWLESLPEGLDTDVGQAGDLVSGGERRRIALGRALLADFPVVVLDEPTADVDPAAAARIAHDVVTDARRRDRAVLLITHGDEGLDAVDEIVAIDHSHRRAPSVLSL